MITLALEKELRSQHLDPLVASREREWTWVLKLQILLPGYMLQYRGMPGPGKRIGWVGEKGRRRV